MIASLSRYRLEESKRVGVSVDSERRNCPGHLLDISHSRQILQIRVARDHLGFLVLGGGIGGI